MASALCFASSSSIAVSSFFVVPLDRLLKGSLTAAMRPSFLEAISVGSSQSTDMSCPPASPFSLGWLLLAFDADVGGQTGGCSECQQSCASSRQDMTRSASLLYCVDTQGGSTVALVGGRHDGRPTQHVGCWI